MHPGGSGPSSQGTPVSRAFSTALTTASSGSDGRPHGMKPKRAMWASRASSAVIFLLGFGKKRSFMNPPINDGFIVTRCADMFYG